MDEVVIALRDHYVDAVSGYLATLIHLFEQNHVQNSLNAGMKGHIAKPVDVNKLVNTLSVFVKGFN